jgi:hypothetical protein
VRLDGAGARARLAFHGEVNLIRLKSLVGWVTVLCFSAALMAGCDTSGTNPKAIEVPASGTGGDVNKPLPTDVKQGGGPGSSGNMKKSPADST